MSTGSDYRILTEGQEGRTYKAGETIFVAGDTGREMYIVKAGSVGIFIGDKLVETVTEQGVFGEMALIDGSARSATAKAETDTVVVPVEERQFLFMVEETPFFALRVMRTLASRLRRTSKE